MRIRPWVNRLGCDVGLTEVMLCLSGGESVLRVHHYTESDHLKHLVVRPGLPADARIEDVPGGGIVEAVRQCRSRGERVR